VSLGAVLLVEDDRSLRESTAEILEAHGFEVAVAADGAAATWLLATREFDVVVLDLRLCHVDGTVVLDSLEAPARVVIVSAFASLDENEVRDEFRPLIFECLRKPVGPDHLVEVVTAAAAQPLEHGTRVAPIEPRDALRLALAGLAHVAPEEEAG